MVNDTCVRSAMLYGSEVTHGLPERLSLPDHREIGKHAPVCMRRRAGGSSRSCNGVWEAGHV